jgi:hypothetical protein
MKNMHIVVIMRHAMMGTMMPTASAVTGGPWCFFGGCCSGESEGLLVAAAVEKTVAAAEEY